MTDTVLEIKALKKTYPGKGARQEVLALKGIDLEVKKGEFVALHGPSGCGKSTLLLTAGGLLKPDNGSVKINNQQLYELNNSDRAHFRAKNLGFVFQQFHLIPYLDVLGNVIVSEMATGRTTDAESRAIEILAKFDMVDRKHHHPSELSVGEQQRVALARAVFAGANILFADEPTGNLDHKNADLVLNYIKEFAENGGAAVMVTHDDRALEYASRRISLSEGLITKED
jgi:putative ABC transport system ATP-binding protein